MAEPLQDPTYFRQVTVDTELGTVERARSLRQDLPAGLVDKRRQTTEQ
ncbi:MAG: hypothetical protein ACRDK4_06765 [Solirubrobacteraceae bacterium]